MGKSIAKAILERENLRLVGLIEINPTLTGKTVEESLTSDMRSKTKIHRNLESFTSEFTDSVNVVVIATSSALDIVKPTIIECMKQGMHVISICEELSFPYSRHPELSKEIDDAATKFNRTVLGTGINPGYLMDLLPIVLSAPCQTVETITVTRHMNSSHRRFSFQKKIGTGMTQGEFRKNIDEGHITGHVGLVESIRMIDDALNLGLDKIEELPPEAVIAEDEITNSFFTIKKGDVLGLKSRGIGSKDGDAIVKLDFLAYAEASPQYDEVIIEGIPRIHQRIEGGVQGDYATIGMILNLIPLIETVDPGLVTMKDIPVPRNTERFYST
ncbi:MAG: hypothetical protein RTU92_11385 [Candidatus Thorarchaeota archaeon]